jgi:hypothetical protein
MMRDHNVASLAEAELDRSITTKSKNGTQRFGSDGGRFPLLSGASVSPVPSVSSSGSIHATGSFLCTRLHKALPDAQIHPDKWTLAAKR